MSAQRTIDVSQLPTYAFGHRALTWWATWSMLLMEGTMFVILLLSYFFLRTGIPDWPPGRTPPPNLFWGTLKYCDHPGERHSQLPREEGG